MLRETDALCVVDDLLQMYRRTSVLLHRPCPSNTAPDVRSRVGGLPNLPAEFEWPLGRRSGNSQPPLHFLAQVDCAEVPHVHPAMPTEGLLFFFARDDDEQIWSDGAAPDSVRVMYAPNVALGQPRRAAPPNLMPLRRPHSRTDWRLPDEPGTSLHRAWPLVPLRIDSWPDFSSIYFTQAVRELEKRGWAIAEIGRAYERRVNALRFGAVVTVTSLPTHTGLEPQWGTSIAMLSGGTKFALPQDFSRDPRPFPPLGLVMDRISRLVIRQALSLLDHKSYQEPARRQALDGTVTTGHRWIRAANDIGALACPDADSAAGFNAWLESLGVPGSLISGSMPQVLTNAIRSVIEDAMDDPTLAARIPAGFYNRLENHYLPYTQLKRAREEQCEDWSLSTHFHEMLGFQRSRQEAESVDEDAVLLLQMDTDLALDMTFGDAGSACFWIKPDDLMARNFENVWADVVGH